MPIASEYNKDSRDRSITVEEKVQQNIITPIWHSSIATRRKYIEENADITSEAVDTHMKYRMRQLQEDPEELFSLH